jgi:hypothetical protein
MDRSKGRFMATTEESISELLDTLNTRTIEDTHFKWTSDHNYGAIPPLTTADFSNLTTSTITIGDTTAPSYTIGNGGIGLTHSNTVWTTSGTSSVNWNQSVVGGIYHNPAMEVNQGGQVSLKGDNADIDINGKSLVKWMQVMEERMNWMQPNVELEAEWDDLKKLGDRYRKLEQKCREKADVWKKLKSMPKPEIR